MDIQVKNGLDIPIEGKPSGAITDLPTPPQVSLNLAPFEGVKFKLLARAGDVVKKGEALVYDKSCPERVWVSPCAGTIKEVRRGLKRRILDIVIDLDADEDQVNFGGLDPNSAAQEVLLAYLLKTGIFTRIHVRPFNLLAKPDHLPRDIFVNACASRPFCPPAEYHVLGLEKEFQVGLDALTKLSKGKVHLTYNKGSDSKAFTEAKGVERHTVSGPHPAGNTSVHIHHIAPIRGVDDIVWTMTAYDVVCMGHVLMHGTLHTDRVVSIAGSGILSEKRGFFRARAGYPVGALLAGRNNKGLLRFISGDVLTGQAVEIDDFLGFFDDTFTVIPENTSREFMHFFRLGANKFSASRVYLSGHLPKGARTYEMNTSCHGEERAFVDARVYQNVMPMQVPVMFLAKAVIAQDFDSAEELGLLEVVGEDFALPTFVCPSKIEMVKIIDQGIREYAAETVA